MARFGLSPFANPIEAGIDSFAKLNQVFNQNDRLEIEKQDAAQRRQMNDLRMSEERQKQQWEQEDRPAVAAQNQALKLQAEHKILQGPITSAMTKNYQAMANGTQPEYSPEEIDAVLHLQKQAPMLSDDPKEATVQVSALHNLQQTMGQITPALVQQAQQMPQGQRKVRISDQNAPGLVDNFNVAFKRLLNGKEAESFLIDMDQGSVIPIIKGEEGKPTPLTKGEGDKSTIHQIPLSILQQYVSKGAAFGNLLLPALAQVEGNGKLMEEVKKAGETRQRAQADATVLEQIDADTDPVEARKQYIKLMGKAGYSVTEKDAEARFPKDKLTRDIVADKDSPTGFSYLTEQGNLRPGAPDPDAKERALDRRAEIREEHADKRATIREEGADRRANQRELRMENRDNSSKRRDALVKEKLALLSKDPDWEGKEFAERQSEAERQADAQIEGRPAPRQDTPSNSPLVDYFKGKKGGVFGDDIEADVKSAADKWSEGDVRAAAKASKNKEVQAEVEKYYQKNSGSVQKKNERTVQDDSRNGFSSMPNAALYNGKVLRDKQTGKRYKSNGNQWVEIN